MNASASRISHLVAEASPDFYGAWVPQPPPPDARPSRPHVDNPAHSPIFVARDKARHPAERAEHFSAPRRARHDRGRTLARRRLLVQGYSAPTSPSRGLTTWLSSPRTILRRNKPIPSGTRGSRCHEEPDRYDP